jgi:hypothetical protein
MGWFLSVGSDEVRDRHGALKKTIFYTKVKDQNCEVGYYKE